MFVNSRNRTGLDAFHGEQLNLKTANCFKVDYEGEKYTNPAHPVWNFCIQKLAAPSSLVGIKLCDPTNHIQASLTANHVLTFRSLKSDGDSEI